MEPAVKVVRRICQQRNVNAVDLLGIMLDSMAQFQFAAQIHRQPNHSAIDEIHSVVGLLEQTELPRSMLAAIDLFVEVPHLHNIRQLEVDRQRGAPPEQIEGRIRFIGLHETVRLILRDLMNQAERSGIEASLELEKQKEADDESAP